MESVGVMRLWLTTVFVLFALVQAFQWVKGLILPLPLYVLAGAFLAIASNTEKGLGAMLNSTPSPTTANPPPQTATVIEDNPLLPSDTETLNERSRAQ